jgi:ribonuclease HII
MRRAVEALTVTPTFALVDGNYAFSLPCAVRTVVGGDAISVSIAAASILAKTARDRLMVELDALYPGYGFSSHKGYGAPSHQEALRRLGPCPAHRSTWAPVRALLGPAPAAAFPFTEEPGLGDPALQSRVICGETR